MGVEIRVKNNDCIRAPEVDTHTTSSSAQEIDEDIRAWAIELIHILLSVRLFCRAILEFTAQSAQSIIKVLVYKIITSRRCLSPSPSRKSSMTSKAMTNFGQPMNPDR
jgi:hypothetical protein